MNIGDALEWAAGACLIAAAYLGLGDSASIGAAGLFLFYQAQCFSGHALRLRLRRRPKKREEPAWPV